MTACERCGHAEAVKYAVCLVNIDEDSYEEGSHVADVETWLCSECESAVGDWLLTCNHSAVDKEDTEQRLEAWKRTPLGREAFARVIRKSIETAFRAGADWRPDQ